jgi:hypothetical protein
MILGTTEIRLIREITLVEQFPELIEFREWV